MTVDVTIKTQLREQRLKALQAQYFDLEMTAVALEANGRTVQAEEIRRKMTETDISYQAVLAIVIE
jgi:hypothetical protein